MHMTVKDCLAKEGVLLADNPVSGVRHLAHALEVAERVGGKGFPWQYYWLTAVDKNIEFGWVCELGKPVRLAELIPTSSD
jgi:hypothetical protein